MGKFLKNKTGFIQHHFRENKNGAGFTLIEVILYVAILSILLVSVVQINLIIKDSLIKFDSQRRVNSDLSTFLNNVNFLVRNSNGLASDNTTDCYDFSGSQGPADYYLSLYFDTTSAETILPAECRGKGTETASTTAVKIYWKDSSHRGLWMDCYQGFINGNVGNCATIEAAGDVSLMMTSNKNTVVYDGGLSFTTSTVAGQTALSTSVTIGIPLSSDIRYSATTTASSTVAFRIKLGNDAAPTEAVCGNGSLEGDEVCDSTLATACSENSSYYKAGYVEDDSTCDNDVACNGTCSACLTSLACNGPVCGNGVVEGSEVCDSGLTTACSLNGSYYKDSYVEDGVTCSGGYACNNTCSACIAQSSCEAVCGNGVKETGETCDYTGKTLCPTNRNYHVNSVGCSAGTDACKTDCSTCITQSQCLGF